MVTVLLDFFRLEFLEGWIKGMHLVQPLTKIRAFGPVGVFSFHARQSASYVKRLEFGKESFVILGALALDRVCFEVFLVQRNNMVAELKSKCGIRIW